MSQEILWAPWRLQYIKEPKDESGPDCFLCRYIAEQNDAENLVVARGPRTITVLNRYPYNNGHLLVAPLAHKGDFEQLDDEEMLECMQVLQQMTSAMQQCLSPQGFNIGLNLGHVAGAGLPGHLHWHIVPRWSGDTNFMTVVSGTTVIPQSLHALYDLLKETLGDEAK